MAKTTKKTTTKKTKHATALDARVAPGGVDSTALAQAEQIAEATLAAREATEHQLLQDRIAAADPERVLANGSTTTRPYCPICREHFHTDSRHWKVSRFLARHAKQPYTDPAFLAWLEKHAEAEGLSFPKAS